MARTATLPVLNGESGLSRYLAEIRKFPMLEPQQEYMLAKRWREHDDRDAAHQLVTSHLRLVAKIAMGYRGYGLPISEVVSEGNVGLMQAVKRFEPEKGFRLATYAMWWIKASIQEYILRSWSLVKMGTTANQKKLFFNLRKAKSKISALDEGDLHPDQVKLIAKRLGVTDQDVVDMNRRLGGDASLNAPIRDDGEAGEWQDWLVDNSPNQEAIMAEHEEFDHRRQALNGAIGVLNPRERRIFEARRLAEDPMTLEDLASRIRRVARARAADRGPRLRKGAVRGQGHHRPAGAGRTGSRALISRDERRRNSRKPAATPAFCLGALAQGLLGDRIIGGRRWRRVDRIAVLALLLGCVKRVVGGGDQPVRERAHVPRPLRDPDRDRDRDIGADAAGGVLAAHLQHAARDHRALAQRE